MNFFINGFLVVQACLGRQADYTTNQFKSSLFSWFARRIAVLLAALGIESRFGWLYRHKQRASSPGCNAWLG